jgi:hypothetical protein
MYVLILTKMGWAKFWAIVVTLVPTPFAVMKLCTQELIQTSFLTYVYEYPGFYAYMKFRTLV